MPEADGENRDVLVVRRNVTDELDQPRRKAALRIEAGVLWNVS